MSRYKTYSTENVSPKPDWMSKTLWVNLLTGVIGGLGLVLKEGTISQETAGVITMVGAILTIVFRYMNNQPIEFTGTRLFTGKKNDRPGRM